MKKIITLLLICFLFGKVSAQYIQKEYFNEDFSGNSIPSGWTTISNPENMSWRVGNPGAGWAILNPPNTQNTLMTFPMAHFYQDHFDFIYKNSSLETGTFDVSSLPPEGSVKIEFQYQFVPQGGYPANFFVEVYNGNSWVEVSHFTEPSSNPAYYQADITSALAAASNAKVRFRFKGSFRSHLFIDNVKIYDVNTLCNKPQNLTTSNITPVSMDVSWNSGSSETSWQVIYGQTGFDPEAGEGNSVNVSNTNTKTLTGLLPDTAYDVYVRRFCGTNASFLSDPITANTDCGGVTSFPWLENFDTASYNLPQCWDCINVSGFGLCFSPAEPVAYPGNKAARLSGDGGIYLMLSPVFLNGNQQLRFKTLGPNTTNFFSYQVKLSTTSNDPSDYETTLRASTGIKHTAYEKVDPISLSGYTGYVYLGIFTENSYLSNDFYYFDDFVIEDIPICQTPTNLQVIAEDYNGVTIDWTENGPAYKWEVVYGPSGFDPETEGTSLLKEDGESELTITELELDTSYDYYVRAICSSSNKSSFSNVGHFEAPCSFYDNFFESFQSLNSLPGCWYKLIDSSSGNTHVEVGNYDPFNGNNSLAELKTDNGAVYLITPRLNSLSEGTNQLRFSAEGDYFSSFEVGTLTNINDASTFTSLATYTTSGAGQFDQHLLPFYDDLTDVQIAFKVSGNNTIHVDNIYWETSTYYCYEPANFQVEEVGQTYVDLSWEENGSAEAWKIIYGEPGFDPETEGFTFIDDDEVAGETLPNLTMDTHYEVYISPVCDSGDQIINQTPLNFYTGYCNGDLPTSLQGEGLLKITVANEEFFSGGDNSIYEVFTNQVVSLPQGLKAETKVTFQTGMSYHTNIWIDFNDDLIFSSDELVSQAESLANNPTTLDASFTLSINANLGIHRMRIATADTGQTIPDPCYNGTNGIVADFQINITEAPSCFPPTYLEAENIDGATSQIQWQENASATTWEIIYGEPGFDPESEGNMLTDNDGISSLLLTGLTPNNDYEFYVKAICGENDESVLVGPKSFNNSCPPLGDFSENFDSASYLPSCWLNLIDGPDQLSNGSLSVNINPNNYHSPSNSTHLFNNNVPSAELYLITPHLSALNNGGYQIRFFADFNGEVTLDVGLIEDPLDASSYENIKTITSKNGFYEYIVRFEEVYTQKHIAFKSSSTSNYTSIFIDDVIWEPIPSCKRPFNLNVENIGTNSAEIIWESENNESSWDIVYGEAGFNPLTEGITLTDNDGLEGTTLTGLEPTTTYDFYVKANCEQNDQSSLAGPKSFKTLCVPFGDFSEDFEDDIELPDCWNAILNAPSSITSSISVVNYGGIGNSSALQVSNYNSDLSELYLVTPELSTIQNGNHQLRVSAKNSPNAILEVGTMTDPNNPSTFMTVQEIAGTTSYEEYEIAFDGAYTGQYIAFKSTFTNNATAEVYLDNFFWEPIANCQKPTSLTAGNITQTTANLLWNKEGGETSWELIYGTPGFDPEIGGITVTDNDGAPGVTLTGLQENATYEAYVRAVCDTDNKSALTGPISFIMSCSPFNDFYEGLEYNTNFPSCWTTIIDSSRPYASIIKSSYGGNNNSSSFSFYDSNQTASEALYLITPELTNLNGGRQMRFSATADNNAVLEIGTMSDPADAATFNLIETINATSNIQDFKLVFSETYTNHYIAFKGKFPSQYQSIYIDDVVWEPFTNCNEPINIAISSITESTAKVNWDAGSSEVVWEVIFGEAGFNPQTGGNTITVNTTAFEEILTGLQPSTVYEVYVKAICPTTEESSLYGVAPIQFETICAPIGDFAENFDTLPVNAIPDCWQKIVDSENSSIIFGANNLDSYSPPNFMVMYNGNDQNALLYLVTPMLSNLTDGNHQLRFKVKKDINANLQVGTMEDFNDPSTFNAVQTIQATNTYQEFNVEFGDVGNHQFIAFKAYYTGTTQVVYLDDVSWETVSCPKPSALSVSNFIENSIDLSWEEVGAANAWEIKYGATGFDLQTEGVSVLDSDGLLGESISNLNPNIEYEFYVKSKCGENELSEWAGPKKFINPPINDDACNAITLSLDSGCVGGVYTNTGATIENNEPTESCWGDSDYLRTVWFKFLAPESGNITITTEFLGGSLLNNHFKVYEAPIDCSNLQTLGAITTCSDINTTGATINPSYLTPGEYYYIQVSGYNNLQGTFCIEVQEEADYYYGYDYYDAENEFRWHPQDPQGLGVVLNEVEIKAGTVSFLENMTIENLKVNSEANLNVESVLTINQSLVNEGNLTFKSSANKNGELGAVPPGTIISGDVVVERYMSANRAYRFVSTPLTTTSSIHENWQESASSALNNPKPGFGTHITGSLTGENGFDASGSGSPSLFTLDTNNQAFIPVTNTDQNILFAGDAYLIFVRGDRSIDLTTNNLDPNETVIRTKGSIFKGSYTNTNFSTVAGSFGLFGNPYQSSVNMNNALANSTNLNSNQYYVYDPTLADYGAYVTVMLPSGTTFGGNANQYLQPGQSAQIATLANGPASITFSETDKAPGEHSTTFRNSFLAENHYIVGQLFTKESYNSGGSIYDSFGLFFRTDFDSNITEQDAVKAFNFGENIGILTNNETYSLQQRTFPLETEEIQLVINNFNHDNYTLILEVAGMENQTVFLKDNFTGLSQELSIGMTAYSFAIDDDLEASFAHNRFYLYFEENSLNTKDKQNEKDLRIYPNPTNSENGFYIISDYLMGKKIKISIQDVMGKTLESKEKTFFESKLFISTTTLSGGVYFVMLETGEQRIVKRLVIE